MTIALVGMEKEFIELIQKNNGIIHKICNVYFLNNPYKEDYYQEILIRLWKTYPTYKKQSAFSTWLYRVALNTAIDILRKEYIQPQHTEITDKQYNITTEEIDRTDSKDQLYEVIQYLSEIEKAIILLYLEGYSYKEISDIIGLPENNIGVKINRIKTKLLKILEDGKR